MRTRYVEEPFARDTFLAYRRPTGSNPFHPSRDPLAAILPLFPRRFQLPIPLGLNLLLMPGEHILRRDVADGAVQTQVIVMLCVTLILTDIRFLHFQLRQDTFRWSLSVAGPFVCRCLTS